jgi:hypothetical protein
MKRKIIVNASQRKPEVRIPRARAFVYYAASLCLIVSVAAMPMFSALVRAEDEAVDVGNSDTSATADEAENDHAAEESVEETPDTEENFAADEEQEEGELTEESSSEEDVGDDAQLAEPLEEEELGESTEEIENVIETDVDIENSNTAEIENDNAVSGNSGGNEISGDKVDGASINTGNVNVYANVLNIVNTNQINSQIVQITEDFNDLSADILMNNPETTPDEMVHNLVSRLCDGITCQSLTTVKLTNSNDAAINNTVIATGNSGGNSISGASSNASITTGNVNALVNVINIVNTNLVNSRWTIATFNVFGDWEGDLVLPSELYFEGIETVGLSDAAANVEQVKKIILDVDNGNQAEIIKM